MTNKTLLHGVPVALLAFYFFPMLFVISILILLIGGLALYGFLYYKFWYIVAKKVWEYKG